MIKILEKYLIKKLKLNIKKRNIKNSIANISKLKKNNFKPRNIFLMKKFVDFFFFLFIYKSSDLFDTRLVFRIHY